MHVWLGRSVTPFNISVAFGKLYHSIDPWTTSRPGLNWLEINLNIRFRQILLCDVTLAFHAVYIWLYLLKAKKLKRILHIVYGSCAGVEILMEKK